MTTGVQPSNTSSTSKSTRSAKSDALAPEQGFDAALAAQWMLNAPIPRERSIAAPESGGGVPSTSAAMRAASKTLSGRWHDESGNVHGAEEPSRANRATCPTSSAEATELSSKELAGQLPSRKDKFLAAQKEQESVEEPPRASSESSRGKRSTNDAVQSDRSVALAAGRQDRCSSVASTIDASGGMRQVDSPKATSANVTATPKGNEASTRVNTAASLRPAGAMSRQAHPQAAMPSAPGSSKEGRSAAGPIQASRTGAMPSAKKAATSVSPRHAPTPELEHPVATQALRGLAAALRQGNGSVTLHLSPENLGELRLSVTVKKAEVVARVEATSEEAARALKENSGALREALEAQGFAVSRVEVEQVSPALLKMHERHGAEQQATPQQWAGGQPNGGRSSFSADADAKRERASENFTGTPIAEVEVAALSYINAAGVNAIA